MVKRRIPWLTGDPIIAFSISRFQKWSLKKRRLRPRGNLALLDVCWAVTQGSAGLESRCLTAWHADTNSSHTFD